MSPTRRDVLASFAAAGSATLLPRWAWGDPVDGPAAELPTLVVLYLRGGCDPINVVAPYGDPMYAKIRPTIALPAPGQGSRENRAVLPIDKYFGFHPALEPLQRFYEEGSFTSILCTGSTHPTRSHFDAQDFMERAAPGVKSITEGWLNRFLTGTKTDHDADLRAVSLQPVLPRSMRGQYPVLAVPDYGAVEATDLFEKLYDCESNQEANRKLYGDDAQAPADDPRTPRQRNLDRIARAGTESIDTLRQLTAALNGKKRDRRGYPNSTLGHQFRDLAALIKAKRGLQISALDYHGWDHHAYQGASNGTQARMLLEMSRTLAAFMDDLGPARDRTLVLAMTEFGRTVHENGNNGTDHGHGGFMLALGGPVKGNRMYGNWSGLQRRQLYDGRDLPIHTDFRDVFAETLQAMYGFDADAHDFFPEYEAKPKSLGFLKPVSSA